jgi:hypothetical protein
MEQEENKNYLLAGSPRPDLGTKAGSSDQKKKKPWWPLIKLGAKFGFQGAEKYYKKKIFGVKRRTNLFLIMAVIISAVIIFCLWAYSLDYSQGQKIEFNVGYSGTYANFLGLDWQETYLAILNDLKPKKVRIPVYWNLLEPNKKDYQWGDIDWQLTEAQSRDIEVVLVIGRRVPRWPECHEPLWVKSLVTKDQEAEILNLLKEEVNHFKSFDHIVMWQLENEPLFNLFGKCPKITPAFLQKEMQVVKSLDTRPVMITDSGELSLWLRSGRVAEVLGTTMYRVVWNPLTGYFKHFYPPAFYRWRASWTEKFGTTKKVIISELQAEPWAMKGKFIGQVPLADQFRGFSLEQFKNSVEFAKKAGLKEAYFWGAEWWYWLKEVHGNSDYWDYAKQVISGEQTNF